MQTFNLLILCFKATCEHVKVESPDMLWNNLGLSPLKRKVDDNKTTKEKHNVYDKTKTRFLNVLQAQIIPVCFTCK